VDPPTSRQLKLRAFQSLAMFVLSSFAESLLMDRFFPSVREWWNTLRKAQGERIVLPRSSKEKGTVPFFSD
jgi:hypothetical protein